MSAYAQLEAHFKRLNSLRGASAMLHWDNATQLPSGSGAVRAEHMAALAEIMHQQQMHSSLPDWCEQAKAETLDDWQHANLNEMQRQLAHERAVPEALVSVLSKACSESEMRWRQAKAEDDFAGYAPYLQQVLDLTREAAAAKGAALGLSAYDALVDMYEPGLTTAVIEPVFSAVEHFIKPLMHQVVESQRHAPALPEQAIGVEKQAALARFIMERLGFDFSAGRLDVSAHPFCGGVPGDVRLTTRFSETDALAGFYGVVHETGHALYEMQLPERWRLQPVGEARGMAMHESQSLLMEMQLGLSRPFLQFIAPHLQHFFGVDGPAWQAEALHARLTRVTPSLIRVEADEVTYPLHVILRTRLESQMIEGKLEVRHLPEAWREEMRKLLGIVPETDAQGCLQDIHWPDGAFGYFPSYLFGAIYAAQIFKAAKDALPELDAHVAAGDFKPLTRWLGQQVHAQGSRYASSELIAMATHKAVTVEAYENHLINRYIKS